ncbi:MAG: formyltransferase family protein [Promethearchaeota archaeon]
MLKVCYVGNVEFSWEVLNEFLSNRYPIQAVFQVNEEGAKFHSDFRSTRDLAEKHGIPYHTFRNINEPENVAVLKRYEPDVLLVFGLSQIIRPEVLYLPKVGCIGTHPSLLPKNRGRAAIPWSILKGLKESGLTFFFLDEGMDSGDVILQERWEITEEDTATTLYGKMVEAGKRGARKLMQYFREGKIPRTPQDHSQATFWEKRTPEDGLIRWNAMTVKQIHDLVRAVTTPYPGAFTYYRGDKVTFWASAYRAGETGRPPGEILGVKSDGLEVSAIDGTLVVKDLEVGGRRGKPPEFAGKFERGEKFCERCA